MGGSPQSVSHSFQPLQQARMTNVIVQYYAVLCEDLFCVVFINYFLSKAKGSLHLKAMHMYESRSFVL